MVWILDSLNSKSYQLGLGKKLAATAGERSMDGAEFIATQSHGIPLLWLSEIKGRFGVMGSEKTAAKNTSCYNSSPRRINVELDQGGAAVKGRT
jgi:hypothetical protein